ncbi:MAG: helix-turn-helix domain-containing protein [Acidimicrobiia bacterium]
MVVATLLTQRRRQAGLTQRLLAERAGTSAAAVCLYEQGARVPRVDTLARLLAAGGATLELGAQVSPASIDVAANGRILEELLELAEQLPHRPDRDLRFPIVRDLAA